MKTASLVALFCLCLLGTGKVSAARPNIIFLMADDQSTYSVGCYGNPDVRTPNMDQLGADGVIFDRHYDTTAICMASRATVFTGMYEYKHGCNFTHGDMKPEVWAKSYPRLLRNAGYLTAFAGKFGMKVGGLGHCEADFDLWGGSPGQSNYRTEKNKSMKQYAEEYPHSTLSYGAFGRDVIRKFAKQDRPFCLSISFKAPHMPATPDPRFDSVYAGKKFTRPANFGREAGEHLAPQSKTGRQFERFTSWNYDKDYDGAMAKYHQLVHGIDAALGMVRDELEAQGITENTVIIYTSDNGFICGSHGYGSKVLPMEEASRVPLMIFDPRSPNAGRKFRTSRLTGNIDIAPTILDLAGIAIPQNMDGKSLLKVLESPERGGHEQLALMNVFGKGASTCLTALTSRFKYTYWWYSDGKMETTEELFDLTEDPLEMANLVGHTDFDQVLDEMRERYDREHARWKEQAVDYNGYQEFIERFERKIASAKKAEAKPASMAKDKQDLEALKKARAERRRQRGKTKPSKKSSETTARPSKLSGSRPNIVFVLTDDQGYGDLGCHGHPFVKTPHLDKLHRQSIRFTDFHTSPTCSPARAGLMSGLAPFKVGVTHTIFERERMALGVPTVADVLQKAGYRTAIFGKWHLGDADPYQPQNRGFDEVFIHGGGGVGQGWDAPGNTYFDPVIRHNGRFVKTKGFCTDVFFAEALRWIHSQRESRQPFFAYLSLNAPHGPFIAPDNYRAMYDADKEPGFFGMISNIDDNMGRLMEKLKAWALESNTLLIFMTDNGSVKSRYYNAGMTGGKNTAHEGGSRVPFFLRPPGQINAGAEVSPLTRHFDLLPTFADLAGANVEGMQLDGRSLIPLIDDPQAEWPDRTMFFHKGRWGDPNARQAKHRRDPGPENGKYLNFAVRDETWRLVGRSKTKLALYNVKTDPGESEDLARRHPDRVDTMMTAYEKWWTSVRPRMVNDGIKPGTELYYRTAFKQQEKNGGIPNWIQPQID